MLENQVVFERKVPVFFFVVTCTLLAVNALVDLQAALEHGKTALVVINIVGACGWLGNAIVWWIIAE